MPNYSVQYKGQSVRIKRLKPKDWVIVVQDGDSSNNLVCVLGPYTEKGAERVANKERRRSFGLMYSTYPMVRR